MHGCLAQGVAEHEGKLEKAALEGLGLFIEVVMWKGFLFPYPHLLRGQKSSCSTRQEGWQQGKGSLGRNHILCWSPVGYKELEAGN